jgi:nitrite reductase/ring-hydroxylating ferredoxin subunit
MKKLILAVFIGFLMSSCSKNDDANNNNPYLPEQNFDTGTTINTNFPQYNSLQFPGNHSVINGFGINGIVVYNSGSSYIAFELSDPNHALQSCSKLTVEGVIATCGCTGEKQYDILTGQAQQGTTGQYTLKPYFVETSGNIIRVYNN